MLRLTLRRALLFGGLGALALIGLSPLITSLLSISHTASTISASAPTVTPRNKDEPSKMLVSRGVTSPSCAGRTAQTTTSNRTSSGPGWR